MPRRIVFILGFFVMMGAITSSVALLYAQKEVVDRVVAVVEDEAIFQSEVDQLIKQFLMQRGVTELTQRERLEIEQQALDELINSKLIVAKAGRLGIDVSFSEVEKAVERAIEENMNTLGGEDAFEKQLEAEGLTIDALRQLYREQIRNRMLVDRVLAAEIDRSSMQITEEELRAAFETRQAALPNRPAVVHLRTIYFAMDSSENARSEARAKIEELNDRILAGEDFAEVAREYSEDPSADVGGNLGTLKLDDLADRDFANAAGALSVGEVSEPVLTGYGYHLIQVTAANPDEGEVDLRHILVRINPGDQDVSAVFDRATAIHDSLVADAPFDSMAVKYSDDEATASVGGDLGWLRLEDLPEFFREVLSSMVVGEISQVLREPTGFRIVQLLEREEARSYDFDEVRDELRKMVEQDKMGSTYETYLAGLREEFFVETR